MFKSVGLATKDNNIKKERSNRVMNRRLGGGADDRRQVYDK